MDAQTTALTRTCAECGQAKPLADFDHRFIHKDTNVWCVSCRDARRQDKREWEREQHRIQTEYLQERRRRYNTETPLREEWYRQSAAQGFSAEECRRIIEVHGHIEWSRRPWSKITQQFLSLDPPYISGKRARAAVTTEMRASIFHAQQGKCYYCARTLATLGTVPTRCPPGEDWQAHRASTACVPHLDHMTPVARGGTSALENLCCACRICNQQKCIRTAAEFATMPKDAISKLIILPNMTADGLRYEAQGYTGFDTLLPFSVRESEAMMDFNERWWSQQCPQ